LDILVYWYGVVDGYLEGKMDKVSSVSLEFTKAEIACCDVLTFMTGFAKLGTAMLFGFTHFTWRRLIVLTYTLVLTRTAKFSISHLPVILNAVQNFHSDHFGLFEKTAAGYFRGCSAVNVRARPMSHQGQPYYSPAAARKRRADEGPSAVVRRQWRRRRRRRRRRRWRVGGGGIHERSYGSSASNSPDATTNGRRGKGKVEGVDGSNLGGANGGSSHKSRSNGKGGDWQRGGGGGAASSPKCFLC